MDSLLTRCIFVLWLWTMARAVSNKQVEHLEEQIVNLTIRVEQLERRCNTAPLIAQSDEVESLIIHNLNSIPLKSCKRILDEDSNAPSGLYRVSPCGAEFTVYCNMEMDGGGWTVIQQRVDNSTDFYRDWEDYRKGFGYLQSNLWLGLDKIHCLTHIEPCELLVIISSFSDETAMSKYHHFKVGNKDSSYQLHVRMYNSTVSDGGDALEIHNGQKFSTRDQDNDLSSSENCAAKFHGAWWYKECHESNLNGRYYDKDAVTLSDGIVWLPFTGYHYSAKSVTMAIR